MDTLRRTIILVQEEPTKENGKARLYAFGIRAVASLAGVSLKTARRAETAAELNLGSLRSVLAWVSHHEAATQANATDEADEEGGHRSVLLRRASDRLRCERPVLREVQGDRGVEQPEQPRQPRSGAD